MKKVFTVGVFDYFHYGHLALFQRCKEWGDYLIVAVQDSDWILKYKPSAHILYSTEQRVALIRALRIVDEVVVYKDVDTIIKEVPFDVYCKGPDQSHSGFQAAVSWCQKNGRQVVTIPRTEGICSSDLKSGVL